MGYFFEKYPRDVQFVYIKPKAKPPSMKLTEECKVKLEAMGYKIKPQALSELVGNPSVRKLRLKKLQERDRLYK